MSGREDLERHPDYVATASLDALRRADYGRLDEQDQAYLDYTGAGLFAASQIEAHARLLAAPVLGNPHSASLSSSATTTLVEDARQAVLAYFHATDDYTAIFTLNASGALKHVGESYPFEPGSRLLLTFDNHNSVNGIREFAGAKGARVDYAPLLLPELRIDGPQLETLLDEADPSHPNLFAYPAQSNFSGVKHPLDLVDAAHRRGWDVLLDAAAFVPTSRLDLSVVKADFVAVSFYKMFGYPTGVGCLLARTSALARLRRPWFAGGTVNFATIQVGEHVLSPGEAGFEDGTLNFLSIPAVPIGLRHLEHLGLDTIATRVGCLTRWLLGELLALHHSNGRPLVRIYGPTNMMSRGGTIAMNCCDPDGHLLDYRRIEEMAATERLSFRTGCFCNPGAGEMAEGLTAHDIRSAIDAVTDLTLPRFVAFMREHGGKTAGAIRVSFGIVSNARDAVRFLDFIGTLRDQARLVVGGAASEVGSSHNSRDGA